MSSKVRTLGAKFKEHCFWYYSYVDYYWKAVTYMPLEILARYVQYPLFIHFVCIIKINPSSRVLVCKYS